MNHNIKIHGHYTSADALINILQKECLWATNIKFLNDEHEFQHAIILANQLIERSKPKVSPDDPRRPIYQVFVEETIEALKLLDEIHSDSIFTISFSEKIDLLSQWRGYCQKNLGYCLSIDTEELFKEVQGNYHSAYFFKCIYDNSEKEKQLSALLNSHWLAYLGKDNDEDRQKIISELAKQALLLASHFKHSSFEEEQEHRLVIQVDFNSAKTIKFRTGAFSVIPYLEIPLPHKMIKAVHIGPTNNLSLAKRGLTALLECATGLPEFASPISIRESSIPYRS